ncbi:restriction endonuclease subunit S [Aeromonas veronii]|uniref:restriction endonuclease subunit S n=1 Tax=Aeromonas veronii TaxID=654 RepID=UPI00300488EF
MVPKGWSQKLISDVGAVVTGNTPPTSNPEYYNGKYPFVSPADLGAHKLINSSIKSLSSQGMEKARSVRAGATLFTCIGSTIGKIGLAGCTLATNQQINVVIPKPDYDDDYVYYQLELRAAYIAKLAGTQAVPIINKTTFESQCILVPDSLPEQNKIAKILSTWDKAISTTEQLLANSQQQKKALMQQLLTGKKRLLDNNGVRFSGEWRFKRINQIATRIQRKSDGNEHPILTISSLSGFVRQDERYNRYMAGESVKNYILLERSEFAYNKGNSKTYEFGCVFDLDGYETGLVPHVYVCFKLKTGLSHRYFKYLFEADYLKPQLGALVNTGVRNNGLLNIKPDAFMSTQVPVPCIEEQERIADVLHASSELIGQLQKKLDCLKTEKQALMQQLLTGKRRVKVEEVA